MNKKQREEALRREEDLALQRGLLWVGIAILLEAFLFFVNRYGYHYEATSSGVAMAEGVRSMLAVLRLVGPVVGVAGFALAVLKKNSPKGAWFPMIGVMGFVLMVCGHTVLAFQSSGVRMLNILVAMVGGLGLAFYLYQRELFLPALSCVVAAAGMWYTRYDGKLEAAVCAGVIALILVVSLLLKKGEGTLTLGGQELYFLPAKANFPLTLGVSALALALLAVALVVGGAVAYYLLFVVAAVLFALLVYYTVKMM